jgi:hypothetical protein
MGGNDKESCVSSMFSGYYVGGGRGMRFARLQPSGVVTGFNNLYVAFSTTWSRAAASTSILVSSDLAVGTPCCGALFAVLDSLSNERRRLSSTFWSIMMIFLSTISFNRASISSVRV